MSYDEERVMAQIDADTERADRKAQDARWGGPDLYICSRNHWSEVPERCPECGEHR